MAPKVKTILTTYIVRVNNEITDKFPSLREARQHIKALVINDDINVVHIVKQTINETLLDTYETKTTKVLMVTQLDEGLE
jgi:hypothetical protein